MVVVGVVNEDLASNEDIEKRHSGVVWWLQN